MDSFKNFQRTNYIYALAIILEKLRIPYEFIDAYNLKFTINAIRERNIDTTNMDAQDVDNIIKLILTK